MTIDQQLDLARLKLANTDELQRNIYASGRALEQYYAQLQRTVIVRFQINSQTDPLNPTNTIGSVVRELRGDCFRDLAVASSAIAALDLSAEFAEAEAEVGPLVADIANLEAALAEETHAANLAEAERLAKIDAAREKALAEIERKFPREMVAVG